MSDGCDDATDRHDDGVLAKGVGDYSDDDPSDRTADGRNSENDGRLDGRQTQMLFHEHHDVRMQEAKRCNTQPKLHWKNVSSQKRTIPFYF